MRRLLVLVTMLLMPALAGFGEERLVLSTADKQGVEATLDGMVATWNRHDMDGLAALLEERCEWVNVVGAYWPDKAAVMRALRAYHATMFKNVSQHETGRSVGEIAPGVAIAVVTFTMDDYTTPDGRWMSGVTNRITYILVKEQGRWLVRSGHNTTIDPIAVAHDPNHPR